MTEITIKSDRQRANVDYADALIYGYQLERNGPTEILQLGQNEILAINRGANLIVIAKIEFKII